MAAVSRSQPRFQACDREPLAVGFTRLVQEGRQVAEASDDFLQELKLP